MAPKPDTTQTQQAAKPGLTLKPVDGEQPPAGNEQAEDNAAAGTEDDAKAAAQPSAADVAEAAGKIAAEKLQQAEQAKRPVPGPAVQAALDAARRAPLTGVEAIRARAEKTVTMIFPRPVLLTLNDHSRISFPAGTQEVPESLANHQYLKRSGVKPYKK